IVNLWTGSNFVGLLSFSPKLFLRQIPCLGPGFKMIILTSQRMGLKLLLNMKLLSLIILETWNIISLP
ncbi:hypothetical protein EJD97_000947, partial [Solanum chilense]